MGTKAPASDAVGLVGAADPLVTVMERVAIQLPPRGVCVVRRGCGQIGQCAYMCSPVRRVRTS